MADIFRRRGPAWRASHAGHVSLAQLKVMSAIERCRTAALGGHVERCEACAHLRISYNSCRNRHCPKCQAAAAKEWLADRQAELLPVPYCHVVFTFPALIADIAYQNKTVIYDILFKAAAETLITIAADPSTAGPASGSPRCCTAGAQRSPTTRTSTSLYRAAASRWMGNGGPRADPASSRPYACCRGCFDACSWRSWWPPTTAAACSFFGDHARLAGRRAFTAYLAPLRRAEWVVYSKRPFGGPEAVLAYLSRYTHRIAIANSRLVAFDGERVTFRW